MRGPAADWFLADESGSHSRDPHFSPRLYEKGDPRIRVALLAEDNLADVLLIQEAIELYALPLDLHIVEDGEKALEFIRAAENDSEAPCPELLLLDLNLPRRSGKEVLERVRQSRKFKDIPVLIITSSDVAKERDELARLGANRYFRKPSNYEAFLKVGQVLKELLEEDAVN